MILQCHNSIEGRPQCKGSQAALILLHLESCLIVFLLFAGKIRTCGRAVRLELGLGFLHLLLRIRELQFRLFALYHRNNLLFAGIQARLLNVELCFHHVGEVLLLLQTRGCPRLMNLRFR